MRVRASRPAAGSRRLRLIYSSHSVRVGRGRSVHAPVSAPLRAVNRICYRSLASLCARRPALEAKSERAPSPAPRAAEQRNSRRVQIAQSAHLYPRADGTLSPQPQSVPAMPAQPPADDSRLAFPSFEAFARAFAAAIKPDVGAWHQEFMKMMVCGRPTRAPVGGVSCADGTRRNTAITQTIKTRSSKCSSCGTSSSRAGSSLACS